jgi:hypothetical protein
VISFFSGHNRDAKIAARTADALIAQYGVFCAYEEARRRCRDPKVAFQNETAHWERVTDVLAKRSGRTNGSLVFDLEIPQNTRFVGVGEPVDVTFKSHPGEVFSGQVEAVSIATEQAQSRLAIAPPQVGSAPFVARIKLNDQDAARRLSAGDTELAAIFTDHNKASRVTRQVVLRQTATLSYVN